MGKYAFGVDVGGTTVKMGLFDEKANLLDKWEIPTVKENKGSSVLPDVAESILTKMKEKGISEGDVAGIGIGVPGPVDESGMLVGGAVNLGWESFYIPAALQAYIKIPVKATNDANAAAFGEMWQGGGKGYQDIVMVTLGTGVGGGIILGGKMLAGVNGAGGEIGHMQVNDDETESCGCGKKGCLEQYTSATGIVRQAKILLNNTDRPSKLRNVQYISAKEIFDAAKEGDELANDLVEAHGESLGRALAQVACVVDPEVFVIGGGVSKAGKVLIDTTAKYFEKYAFHACRGTKFELATLGNDAGIYGGAKLILG